MWRLFYDEIFENIWVQVPQGTDLPPGDNSIYKLNKSLYGLKQAPREWNESINNFLVNELHFERLEADPCMYKKTDTYVEKGVTKYKYSLVALSLLARIRTCVINFRRALLVNLK